MVKISDCFHYIIIFVMLCNETGWHDLQIRQVSGKFAVCAMQFANWLANLAIGRLAWPICKLAGLADWTEYIYRMVTTIGTALIEGHIVDVAEVQY